MATAMRDSFDIEHIISGSNDKPKKAKVHLFVRGNRHKLQVCKKADRSCRILDEIWVDHIGALIITQLKRKR